jgi:hypothetical protein
MAVRGRTDLVTPAADGGRVVNPSAPPVVSPELLTSAASAATLLVLSLAGALFFFTLAVVDLLREVEQRLDATRSPADSRDDDWPDRRGGG